MNVLDLGRYIRIYRAELQISRAAFARKCDIDIQTMAKLEAGKTADPSIATLSRLAIGIGIPLTELINLFDEHSKVQRKHPLT